MKFKDYLIFQRFPDGSVANNLPSRAGDSAGRIPHATTRVRAYATATEPSSGRTWKLHLLSLQARARLLEDESHRVPAGAKARAPQRG